MMSLERAAKILGFSASEIETLKERQKELGSSIHAIEDLIKELQEEKTRIVSDLLGKQAREDETNGSSDPSLLSNID